MAWKRLTRNWLMENAFNHDQVMETLKITSRAWETLESQSGRGTRLNHKQGMEGMENAQITQPKRVA